MTESADWWATHVSRVVKGLLVALALVLVLDRDPDPELTTLALTGALVAMWAADLYASVLESELLRRRGLQRDEIRAIVADVATSAIGLGPSLVLFVLAWLGALGAELAADLAVWIGLALLAGLGLLVALRTGRRPFASIGHTAVLALAGIAVVLVKTLQ